MLGRVEPLATHPLLQSPTKPNGVCEGWELDVIHAGDAQHALLSTSRRVRDVPEEIANEQDAKAMKASKEHDGWHRAKRQPTGSRQLAAGSRHGNVDDSLAR